MFPNVFHEPWSYSGNPYGSAPVIPIPDRFSGLGSITRIGSGSTGVVFRIDGAKSMALKVIYCANHAGKYRLALHEAEILNRLKDVPGIIHLLDQENRESNGIRTVFLLEEYARPVADAIRSSGGLSQAQAFSLILDLCDTLIACREKGVMHLDLKISNLFVADHQQTLLGDFSSALTMEETRVCPGPRGTLDFMAPEVFRGEGVSEQSEIYGMGLMLYAFFNQLYLPFARTSSGQIAVYKRLAGSPIPYLTQTDDQPAGLQDFLLKACAFYPKDRFQSYESFRDALADISQNAELRRTADTWLCCDVRNLSCCETTAQFTEPCMTPQTTDSPSISFL